MTCGVIMFLGLTATPMATHSGSQVPTAEPHQADPRLLTLKSYLKKKQYPMTIWSEDFIEAADRYALDWRLLPAIAIIESTGGKHYRNNNILGWGSCTIPFPSIRDGIHHVAHRLAHSEIYRGKDLDKILRTYNPSALYPGRVRRIMRTLGPLDPVQPLVN